MEKKDDLVGAIMKKTFSDGDRIKLNCASAFYIAEQFGVKISDIGDICNERNIRISSCQLGCFK